MLIVLHQTRATETLRIHLVSTTKIPPTPPTSQLKNALTRSSKVHPVEEVCNVYMQTDL
uniref:Uncharacterized protein n=1 Tax=Anguilla anguilla TaxID=7936 RepID=A0A0E9R2X7_ANGAN